MIFFSKNLLTRETINTLLLACRWEETVEIVLAFIRSCVIYWTLCIEIVYFNEVIKKYNMLFLRHVSMT